jgi:hypothetical protein
VIFIAPNRRQDLVGAQCRSMFRDQEQQQAKRLACQVNRAATAEKTPLSRVEKKWPKAKDFAPFSRRC